MLVGFHLLGAAVIAAAMTWALLSVRHRPAGGTDELEAAYAREPYAHSSEG